GGALLFVGRAEQHLDAGAAEAGIDQRLRDGAAGELVSLEEHLAAGGGRPAGPRPPAGAPPGTRARGAPRRRQPDGARARRARESRPATLGGGESRPAARRASQTRVSAPVKPTAISSASMTMTGRCMRGPP